MSTLVIKDCGEFTVPDASCIDLRQTSVKNCVGCWTCWWKTPGKCIFHDLEDFYRNYINADKVILLDKEVIKEGTPEQVFESLEFKCKFGQI